MNWTSRIVAGSAAAGIMLAGGATVAGALEGRPATEPAPVTITLSPEQVTWLCEQRLPRIESRSFRLVQRIKGDEYTRGSVAWLRARAERERAAGRETTAEVLDERADRRAGRVEQLDRVREWAAEFRTGHCAAR